MHWSRRKEKKKGHSTYGKLILDLGNEVHSSLEQGMAAMEKLVEKLGNTEDKVESRQANAGNDARGSRSVRGQDVTPVVHKCTFAGFMKCNPITFHVKFAAATLQGPTLTWWNVKVATMGLETVNQMPWTKMNQMQGNTRAMITAPTDGKLGTFDVIIGMDWLVKHDGVIVCGEKVVRIPYGNKMLIVESDKGVSRLKVISCIKAQVFPEKLPGLPPPRQWVFMLIQTRSEAIKELSCSDEAIRRRRGSFSNVEAEVVMCIDLFGVSQGMVDIMKVLKLETTEIGVELLSYYDCEIGYSSWKMRNVVADALVWKEKG
ncbi:hypothetical protein Tco_1459231 [Tanacetum coccineum]